MSGEAKKYKGKGKGKGKKSSLSEEEGVSNGISNGHGLKRKERLEAAEGASIITKLVFSVLLVTFTLVASVYLVDYKQGQLAKLTATLPPEVRQAASKGDQLLSQLADNVKGNVGAAKAKVEEIARGIDIGDKGTLGDLLFGPDPALAKKAAEEAAAKKAAAAKKEAERLAAEKAAAEKAAAEKAAAEKAAAEKAAAEKAAAEKAAAEKAAAEKAAAEKAAAEKAAAEKAAAEKAAAEKAAAEKAAAEKAAAEKAAAEKAAAEKAAAEKAAAEKAAAEKAAAEKAAAEKAAAEKAAAEKAEAAAIANMRDPIQELFLTSIRAYGSSGGLASADAAAQDALKAELERVARQYGIEAGEDVTAFPSFEFSDKPVDPINISQ